MLKRVVLVAATAILVPLGAAVASAQPAGAAAAPHATVVNLHQGYLSALRDSHHIKAPMPVYARGAVAEARRRLGTTGQAAECTEPACPVFYHGGPVQHTPHVYLVLWGPDWSTSAGLAAASYLTGFYEGLGDSRDNWSAVTSQYGDATGHPTFGGGVYVGQWQDTAPPPEGATVTQIAAEADAAAAHFGITDDTNAQVVVATQSGTCPAGFAASCNGTSGVNCGYNDETANNVPFVSLPFEPDAGANCTDLSLTNADNGFSIVGSALYADAIADPDLSGWFDQFDGFGVADKCTWVDPVTNLLDVNQVSLGSGTYAVSPLFSDGALASYHDGCVMAPQQDTVGVRPVGNVTTTVGATLNGGALTSAASSAGEAVTWTANGLPPGVTLGSDGTITGGTTTAGTYVVAVTATDTTGATGMTTFTWDVVSGGVIANGEGTASKPLCLDDAGASTTPGNVIDIYRCNGTAAQLWTMHRDGTMHMALGSCMTDPKTGGTKTGQVLDPCVAGPTQEWTFKAEATQNGVQWGEYILRSNKLCLTDPDGSTANKTQVQVRSCSGGSSNLGQLWSQPLTAGPLQHGAARFTPRG